MYERLLIRMLTAVLAHDSHSLQQELDIRRIKEVVGLEFLELETQIICNHLSKLQSRYTIHA